MSNGGVGRDLIGEAGEGWQYGEQVYNQDGTPGDKITTGHNPNDPNYRSYTYTPKPPFMDRRRDTLADIAMDYWKHDLRPDLINNVPTSGKNPAFWQHMVNFTVGYGLTGALALNPAVAIADIKAGRKNWRWNPPQGDGLANDIADTTRRGARLRAKRTDDVFHAAVNSRGKFFAASQPVALANAIANILDRASAETSTASAVTLNDGSTVADNTLYQALFDSADWTGQLSALPIDSNGAVGTAPRWNAADEIPTDSNKRVIITSTNFAGADITPRGKEFRWDKLTGDQKAALSTTLSDTDKDSLSGHLAGRATGLTSDQLTDALANAEDALNYVRGDQSNELENDGGTFRDRASLLGDIIHSSPRYVGSPSARYTDDPRLSSQSKPYSGFKTDNKDRQAMVYIGANDGFLHGFNADTGKELFAYVPYAVTHKLFELAKSDYEHKYFVDETPTVADVFYDSAWHTVLVSGLRGGGQGVFALDITDPDGFKTEAAAKDKVLWELTDSGGAPALGFTYGSPSVVRTNIASGTGAWAAVFSGGYNNTVINGSFSSSGSSHNSPTGNAVLYIRDIKTGASIETFDTKTGIAEDPSITDDTTGRPNGLSSPTLVDIDGDFTVDYAYAGDLFGNVWKIDMSDSNKNNWGFSHGTDGKPKPIYTACATSASTPTCTATNSQPITTKIKVVRHPTRQGYLVLFGTGQYIEADDDTTEGQTTQSFYAIWDKDDATVPTHSKLLQQYIVEEKTATQADQEGNYRITTKNEIDWDDHDGWFINLVNTEGSTTAAGDSTEGSSTANHGERQVSNAFVSGNTVFFTTLLPPDSPCDTGGTGWLMALDISSGGRPNFSPVDQNDGSAFRVGNIDEQISGKKSTSGIIGAPLVVFDGGVQTILTAGSDGGKIESHTAETSGAGGDGGNGRQSWQQLGL